MRELMHAFAPWSFLLWVYAALLAFQLIRTVVRARNARSDSCVNCGYPRRREDSICSECGFEFAREATTAESTSAICRRVTGKSCVLLVLLSTSTLVGWTNGLAGSFPAVLWYAGASCGSKRASELLRISATDGYVSQIDRLVIANFFEFMTFTNDQYVIQNLIVFSDFAYDDRSSAMDDWLRSQRDDIDNKIEIRLQFAERMTYSDVDLAQLDRIVSLVFSDNISLSVDLQTVDSAIALVGMYGNKLPLSVNVVEDYVDRADGEQLRKLKQSLSDAGLESTSSYVKVSNALAKRLD